MFVFKPAPEALVAIPEPVRDALRPRVGDEVAYAIEDGRIVLIRADRDRVESPDRVRLLAKTNR